MPQFFPHHEAASPLKNFSVLVTILIVSYAAVWFLESLPYLATFIILVPGVVFLCYARSYKLLTIAVIASIAGTWHEIFFISKGYWFYHHPSFFSVPAYLPAVWANIGILSVAIYKGILQLDQKNSLFHHPPNFWKAFGATLFGMLFSLIAISLFAPQPFKLLLAFILIDLFYVFFMCSIPLALVGLLSMAAGSVADLISVPIGIWGYPPTTASFFGVPIYIFIGWDVVGILLAGWYVTFDAWSSRKQTFSQNPRFSS